MLLTPLSGSIASSTPLNAARDAAPGRFTEAEPPVEAPGAVELGDDAEDAPFVILLAGVFSNPVIAKPRDAAPALTPGLQSRRIDSPQTMRPGDHAASTAAESSVTAEQMARSAASDATAIRQAPSTAPPRLSDASTDRPTALVAPPDSSPAQSGQVSARAAAASLPEETATIAAEQVAGPARPASTSDVASMSHPPGRIAAMESANPLSVEEMRFDNRRPIDNRLTLSETAHQSASTPAAGAAAPTVATSSSRISFDAVAVAGQITRAVLDRPASESGQDGPRLEVVLDPPELGRVWIRVSRSGDGLTGEISVQNPPLQALLETQLGAIRQGLVDSGLEFAGFELTHQGRQHSQQDGGPQPTGVSRAEAASDVPQPAPGRSHRNHGVDVIV